MARTVVTRGSGSSKYQIIIQIDTGSTVTATKGSTVKTAKERNGIWGFKGLAPGEWTITCTKGEDAVSQTVTIADDEQCKVLVLYYVWVPEFTYTGAYEIVDEDDAPISNPSKHQGDFKIRFLTSGTLVFTKLNRAEVIDLFIVGGGGSACGATGAGNNVRGAGGGGYTATHLSIVPQIGVEYNIVIGAGGTGSEDYNFAGTDGGETSAFGKKAAGGEHGNKDGGYYGGDGGSGGSSSIGSGSKPDTAGTDGNDSTGSSTTYIGKGQRSQPGPNGENGTTREFAEADGNLYSSGGQADSAYTQDTYPGSGGGYAHRSGFNGIAIIRNGRAA